MTTKLISLSKLALVVSAVAAFSIGCNNTTPVVDGGTTAAATGGGSTSSGGSTGAGSTGGSTGAATGGTTGSSGAAALSVTPNTQAFGSVAQGASSTATVFTVTNTGTAASGAVSVTVAGNNAADFVPSANTCTGALAVHATCTVSITFSPSTVGNEAATLTAGATPGGSVSASLTGAGVAAGGITVSPSTFSYGSVTVGQASAAQIFTFTNNAAGASGVPTVALFGGDSTQFQIATAGNTCTAAIAAGSSCTVSVTFNPTLGGPLASSVQLTAAPGGSISAAVSGTGTSPAHITSQPLVGTFGSQIDGATSSPITFTITNQGGVATAALADAISGANAADFAIATDGCTGQVLNPAGTCQLLVTFAPSVIGLEGATLTVTDSAADAAVVALSGTGTSASGLSINNSPASFTSVIGLTSASQTFTVKNAAGSATTGTLTSSFGGANPGDFAIVKGTDGCSGTTLAAGASCNVEIAFSATQATEAATFNVTGTPGGTASATLSGVGVAPALLAATPPSLGFGSIAKGSPSGSQNITVSNSGGAVTGIPSVNVGGTNSADFAITNGCTAALPVGSGTCTIGVVFTPSTTAGESASVTISANPGGSQTVGLTGSGISPSALAFSGTPTTFAANTKITPIDATATAISTTFTLINNGAQTTGPITFAIGTGAGSGDFTAVSGAANGCVSGTTALAAAGTCTIKVTYSPLAADLVGQNGPIFMTQSLVITPTNGSGLTAPLSGWGENPMTFNAGFTADGAGVPTGYAPQTVFKTAFGVPQTFTYYWFNNLTEVSDPNAGATIAGTLAAAMTGDVADFTAGSVVCPSGTPDAACSVTVTFDPVSAGPYTATLTLSGVVLTGTSTAVPADGYSLSGSAVSSTTVPFCTAGGTTSCAGANTVTYDFSNGGANPTTVGSVTQSGGTINTSGVGPSLPSLSLDCSATGGCGLMETSLGGADPSEFYIVSSAVAGQTAAGTYALTVAYIPSAASGATATLTVSNATTGYSATVDLKGNGATPGALAVTGAAAFGSQNVGTSSATESLTVKNTGGQSVTLSSLALKTGTNFTLSYPTGTGSTPCFLTGTGFVTLAASATCTVLAAFSPALDTSPAILGTTVTDSILVNGGSDATLTGTPTSPISISPSTDNISAIIGSTAPAAIPFTITNNGASSIVSPLAAVFSEENGPTGLLSIVSNTCSGNLPGASAAPANTCTVDIALATGTAGVEQVQLAIQEGATGVYAATDPVTGTGPQTPVTGTISSAPLLVTAPASVDFGSSTIGTATAYTEFTVTNNGGNGSGVLTVTPPTGYAVEANPFFGTVTDTCIADLFAGQSGRLASGASCHYFARFDPTVAATAAGQIAVTDGTYSASGGNVTGYGVTSASQLTVTPAYWGFGSEIQGAVSATETFAVFNGTGSTQSIPATLPAEFKIVAAGTTCGATLATGLGCNIEVEFAPTAATPAGSATGQLLIETGATYVALSGTVLTPISLSVTPLTTATSPSDFGSVAKGTTSAAVTVTIENSGNTTATGLAAALAGAEPTEFHISGASTCGNTLAGNSTTCTYEITFDPTQVVSDESATLNVTATGQPTLSVFFEGTGANPATLAMTPTSMQAFASTVVQGDDYHVDEAGAEPQFTLTNSGGVSTSPLVTTLGDIFTIDSSTSSCTTLNYTTNGIPANTSCTFNLDMKTAFTTATGAHNSSFQVTAGTLSTATVAVSGAVSSYLTASPGSTLATAFDYGTVAVGSTASGVFTFTNNSDEYTTGLLEADIGDETDFSVTLDGCSGNVLAGGKSCSITVLFNPAAATASATTVTVTDTAAGGELAKVWMKGNP